MSKREEKKLAKREEIFNNAAKLFVERGYDNVTTAEIAAQSHIAKKTLFQYFDSKEDIIFDDEDSLLEVLVGSLDRKDAWGSFVSFVEQADRENQAINREIIPEVLMLPNIIKDSDTLYGRFLKMLDKYVNGLDVFLMEAGYPHYQANALATIMVNVLRQIFLGEGQVTEILEGQREAAEIVNTKK